MAASTADPSSEFKQDSPTIHTGTNRPLVEASGGDDIAAETRLNQEDARREARTPEPREQNGHRPDPQASPSTPGNLAPFDWEDFEARYDQAIGEANQEEQHLLEEFDRLIKYFNIWATASSAHDNERAAKRLQTRERYVRIAEQSLTEKKRHYQNVVQAFRNALELLQQPK